jgi:class 3 adenylate cyclase
VSGGPDGNDAAAGAANVAAFALDAVDVVKNLEFGSGEKKKKIKIRVGIASGPVVAGVIGTASIPKFTLFGETTSKAEKMESTSLPLKVQCSEETMKLIRSNFRTNKSFQCTRRKDEEDEHQNTWWISRPSEHDNSCVSELDDLLATVMSSTTNDVEASTTADSASPTVSEQNQSNSVISTGTSVEETKGEDTERSIRASGISRRNSSVICELENDGNDEKSYLDIEDFLMSEESKNQGDAKSKKDSCIQNASTSIHITFRSLGNMFRVAEMNKRILFGTFMTFTILCSVGLAILFVFANDYEQDKIQYATEIGNKADRWLDKELDKALLPLFAMSELVKVTNKWDDLPYKIEPTEQHNQGDSIYNNVTGICDDPVYVEPFVDMASSIKSSSGMQGILVNVQLAPFGVLCLTHPKNNTEDFPPGVYLDTTGAIGLNLFDTPSRAASSKAAVIKGEKTIQGPIKLVQGELSVVEEALIARYPVFMDGYSMAIDGMNYPFYGLTIVLMDWDKLKSKFGIYNFFSREQHMEFRMTRYDSWNDKVVVIANSSNHVILNEENSVSIQLEVSDDTWTLMVGFDNGFSPSWVGWGTAAVIVGSLLVSLIVMILLATMEMNKMLLHRMMPRKAIISIEQGKTFVERDSEATVFFSHLIGYQEILSGEMNSKDFLLMLTQLYTEFDKLAIKYKCTKIETIGAYYIVKGPGPDLCSNEEREGVTRIALFSLHAIDLVRRYEYKGVKLQIRAGFATGPIVAGVIGSGGLPKYTVFGDTVNFSSRMESTSAPMRIQCPHLTYSLLRRSSEFLFDLEEREHDGQLGVFVKGKGQTMTYWLNGYTPRGPGINRNSSLLLNGDRDSAEDIGMETDYKDLELDLEADAEMSKRVSFKD